MEPVVAAIKPGMPSCCNIAWFSAILASRFRSNSLIFGAGLGASHMSQQAWAAADSKVHASQVQLIECDRAAADAAGEN
jgi:hypothetical protein